MVIMKNMINRIKRTTLLGTACLMLTGCADFLNILPKDMVTEDNFWDEKTDVEQMVFGCYAAMQSDAFISRVLAWGEMRSDNLYNGTKIQDEGGLYEIMRENILSTNAYTAWTDFYNVINRCNQIIAKAPEVSLKDPTYTESEVRATIAELTTLRALCYFYLIRAYKDVPYYTYPVKQEDQVVDLPASSFETVLDNIIADVESVQDNALKAYPKEAYNTGRITQDAIHALLADMYLWKGDYKKAENYCQMVIDSKVEKFKKEANGSNTMGMGEPTLMKHPDDPGNGYPLYPNNMGGNVYGNAYNQIFANGNSFESIFELSYDPTGVPGDTHLENSAVGRLFGEFTGRDKSNNGLGFLAPPDMIGTDLKNPTPVYFVKEDSRFYENIVSDADFSSFSVRKGVFENTQIVQNGTNFSSFDLFGRTIPDANWIFYRLTDVMLMQAEAYVCQMADDGSEADQELLKKAFYLVWAVNTRSFMGNQTVSNPKLLQLSDYTNKATINNLVLKERQIELMFEGKRWFDLVRQARRDGNTQIVRSKVQPKFTNSTAGTGTLFVNMESLYWPYNKDEIKLNSMLEQKPFYANETEGSYETTN